MPPHAQFPGVANISLKQLCELPYKEQAIWFLNGFWSDGIEDSAEDVWAWYKHALALEARQIPTRGEAGNELDQFWAAKFLEDMEEALTAVERKAAMQDIDIDNNGKMALVEYLTYKFKKGVDAVVSAPQGAAGELLKAQAEVDEALAVLPEVEAKLEQSKTARAEQLAALMQTKQAKIASEDALRKQTEAEADLKLALKMVELAKGELEAAVAELHAAEQAAEEQKKSLESQRDDDSLGAVARGKAASMLNALLNEDPLPLRRAKILQEAALRRVEREQKTAMNKTIEAQAKTEQCKAKLQELHDRETELETSKAKLDEAIAELEESYNKLSVQMSEAKAVIAELKGRGTSGMGALWWMERSLYEADEALPQIKQKYDHKKPFQFTAPAPGAAIMPSPIMGYKKPMGKKPPKPTKPQGLTVKVVQSRQAEAAAARPATDGGADAPAPASADAPAAAPAAAETPAEPEAPLSPAMPAEPVDCTVSYFPFRGRAEMIKLALSEFGVSWAYRKVTGPEFMALKPELAFGSLPLTEIDGLKMVQASSTMRYLARSYQCHPNDSKALWLFDALIDAAEDLRIQAFKAMPKFNGDGAAATKFRDEVIPRHFGQLNAQLKSAEYFVENTFSVADLCVFDVLDACSELVPGCLAEYPTLEQFWSRVAGRDRIAAYMASDKRVAAYEPLEAEA